MIGQIPDVLTVRVTRAVVHPTVVRLLIAIVLAKTKGIQNENLEKNQTLVLQGRLVQLRQVLMPLPLQGPFSSMARLYA